MEIFVDFDNTIVNHSDDLDLSYNKPKGLEWYLSIVDTIEHKLTLSGLLLCQWLQHYDFTILTARGQHNQDIEDTLFHIFNEVPSIIYCSGGHIKKQFLADIGADNYFLIDNNPDYNPDFLFTEHIRIDELSDLFYQKLKESHSRRYNNACYN